MHQFNLPLQNIEELFSRVAYRLRLISLGRIKFNQKRLHMLMFFPVGKGMIKIGLRSAAMTGPTVHPLSIISPNNQALLGIIFFFKKSLQWHPEPLSHTQ